MNKKLFFLIGLLLGLLFIFIYAGKSNASSVKFVPSICKHVNAECFWNKSKHDCCPGLSCKFWKFAGRQKRYKCVRDDVKPTVTPEPTEVPGPTETPKPTDMPEPTITPEPTPEPTVEVTPQPERVYIHTEMPVAPVCQDTVPYRVNDIWVSNPTPNDNMLTVHWGTSDDWDQVNIVYTDTVPGDWKYGIWGTDDDGIEHIGGLTNGTHYWFAVQFKHGCSQGAWSDAVDPLP